MKAFPEVKYIKSGEFGSHVMAIEGGMELRDYFAAKAMPSVVHVARGSEIGIDGGAITEDTHRVARCAYAIADAMLAAREAK